MVQNRLKMVLRTKIKQKTRQLVQSGAVVQENSRFPAPVAILTAHSANLLQLAGA